jgi:YHS domain-containing protein
MFTRRLFLTAATAAIVWAQTKANPVNQNRKSVAIEGYDPVAYFTDGKPMKGKAQLTHLWDGATWQFASAAHRDLFAQAPEQYAPRYGGYCAYAVSEGYTAKIDPQAWKVVDGKLYLNYSKSVQKTWEKDQARRITAVDKNWPALHR